MDNGSVAKQIAGASGEKFGDRWVVEVEASEIPRNRVSVELSSPAGAKLYEALFFLLVAAVLFIGWQIRNEEYLTAESGLGYALGIVGSVLMLLLLLYSFRKRMRLMQDWGATKYWFQAHMIMGVLGPALILFHSNFQVASMNSTVALVSMLLVVASGFVGRYIYTKIHYGLYGSQMSLKKMRGQIENNMNNVPPVFVYAPKVRKRLLSLDAAVLNPCYSLAQSLWQFFILGFWTRWTRLILTLELKRALKKAASREHWTQTEFKRQRSEAAGIVAVHMAMALKVTEFSFFEKLFALWHVFHLPLTILLVIAVVVHVLAVHMY